MSIIRSIAAPNVRTRINQLTQYSVCQCRFFVSRSIGPSSTRHRVAAANARAAVHRRTSEQPTPIPTDLEQEHQTLNPSQTSDPQSVDERQSEFDTRALELLHQIHKGLTDMKEVNSPFDLQLNSHPGYSIKSVTLQLGPKIGSFEISVDSIARRVTLFSPLSGIYHYEYSDVFEQWTSQTDQHFLLELLVRELLKVCRGVPNI